MGRLTRDWTAEHVSRDQILRRTRGQRQKKNPCSPDHEQDWQPYPADPYSTTCDDYKYIHTVRLKYNAPDKKNKKTLISSAFYFIKLHAW